MQTPSKMWVGTGGVKVQIWDCLVFSFADLEKKEHENVRKCAEEIRVALIDLFQTHPDFTDSLVATLLVPVA